VDLKDIKDLIDLMKENDLSVFEMEKEGFKIKLQKESAAPPASIMTAPIALTPQAAAPAPGPASGGAAAAPAADKSMKEIVSPMVGTFFRSPSPDAPPFVEVGKTVDEDTVVGIIEAMKVMNEIKAETSGVIAEISAENGKPVQFGQVLFRVR
jgi:acetyl-CoA carboxylase biotin carboxyl carrier protein